MIGIYKITNKFTGKSYIGQSNDIERRFKEHITHYELAIDFAIQKYGKDNFTFEVLEECLIEELDEKEKYYISFYNTYSGYGYNCNEGGNSVAYDNNPNAKITSQDVYDIRESYNKHERRKEVYKKYKDKITFGSFARIWDGSIWEGIHRDVYTKENLEYYKRHATDGSNSDFALFTDEEVISLRKRYVNETAAEIYKSCSDRCSYDTFQKMLWGHTYSSLPLYKKKTMEWINI